MVLLMAHIITISLRVSVEDRVINFSLESDHRVQINFSYIAAMANRHDDDSFLSRPSLRRPPWTSIICPIILPVNHLNVLPESLMGQHRPCWDQLNSFLVIIGGRSSSPAPTVEMKLNILNIKLLLLYIKKNISYHYTNSRDKHNSRGKVFRMSSCATHILIFR